MKEKRSKRIRKVTIASYLKQHCQTFWRQSRKKIIQNGQGLKVHLDRLAMHSRRVWNAPLTGSAFCYSHRNRLQERAEKMRKRLAIGPKERKCSVCKQIVTEYSPTPPICWKCYYEMAGDLK